MSDITLVAADLRDGPSAIIGTGRAGLDLTVGEVVFFELDGTLRKADCTALATARARGIVLATALSGQAVSYIRGGKLLGGGADADEGTIMVLSEDGGIAPAADLAASDFVTILGVVDDAGNLDMPLSGPWWTDAQVPAA